MVNRSTQPAVTPQLCSRDDHLARIRALQRVSGRGLWLVVSFLLVSLFAYAAAGKDSVFGAQVRRLFGAPPEPHWISAALFVYIFSAIILTLGRMMEGTLTGKGWSHIAYLAAFYAFYLTTGTLEENFWAVFATGITVLSLEGYRFWTICSEKIRESQEEIERLDRWAGFS